MMNMNVTNFRKQIFHVLNTAIEYDEPVNVSTKEGNVVILSEKEYNSLMETLYLSSDPRVKQTIVDGLHTPLSETIPEEEVKW